MAWAANCWCQSIIRNRLNLVFSGSWNDQPEMSHEVPPPHWYAKNWAGSHTSGHPHRTCLHRDHRAIGSHKTPGGFVDIQKASMMGLQPTPPTSCGTRGKKNLLIILKSLLSKHGPSESLQCFMRCQWRVDRLHLKFAAASANTVMRRMWKLRWMVNGHYGENPGTYSEI